MDWFTLRYFKTRQEISSPLANPYYGTLKAIGVNATHKNYDNTVHGFFGAEYLVTHGKQSVIDVCEIIKEHFNLQVN